MEIDEDWQTGTCLRATHRQRKYMKMDYLDEDESNKDEEFMEEIRR